MTTVERPRTDATETAYKVIGTRPIRHDGVDKVTGRARYSADLHLPGMLWGALLRSPHAHARILSIDTSKAEALPGVRAVVTGRDLPPASAATQDQTEGSYLNGGFLTRSVLAIEKALFRGHAVAAVAADTTFIAQEAIGLIEVEYEVLKPVLNGLEAMEPDAPILLEGLTTTTALGKPVGTGAGAPSNVSLNFLMELGDTEKGFAEADLVLERDYEIGGAHQGYIEPFATTASWSPGGHLTLWSSSQGHFSYRDLTAQVLAMSPGDVTVVPMEIGGGFGAKLFPIIEPVAGLLSKKSGRPVRLSMDRTAVFDAVGGTSAGFIHLRMGMKRDGTIVAADTRVVLEAGAFPGSPVGGATNSMLAMYDIANARVEGFDVVVNKPKVTAYRGPGAPIGSLAVESMLDELCDNLGLDPLEVRLKNAAVEGTRRVSGQLMPSLGFVEVLEAARASSHWDSPLEGPNRGRGIAAGFWGNAPGQASMTATVLPDGTVSLLEGSPDIGGTRVVAAMALAEELGIPVESVHPAVGDTDAVGFTSMTGGSSTAFKQTAVAIEVANDIKAQMRSRAAKIMGLPEDEVAYADGVVSSVNDPSKQRTFKEVAAAANQAGGPVTGSATVAIGNPGPSTGVHIADVEVDPETGKITILRFTAIVDAGKAIHPSYVEGQMQGGAVQGIGWAINEEFVYGEDGRMQNSSFLDYRMPTALDLPMIDTVIVEKPMPSHPYGLRGVGEVVIVPPLAALANAVAHATGHRFNTLPMKPSRVLEAIQGSNGQN
ncbi:MAG: xanthine dehydrogenase family protein molybdopterin-binding subunit [Tepidiformaceae bacterium]